MKQVKVTELAFYNGTRVRPGAVLTVADTFSASWAQEVEPKQKVERQPRRPREVAAPEADLV